MGDLEVPKLVFFFDEAHLLFKAASKAFLDQVVQTVRLIRSKGVGIFFITQTPKDLPGDVLAQLGNRIQHALCAFTPDDAKALKATASTFPTSEYDLVEVITAVRAPESACEILAARAEKEAAAQDEAEGRARSRKVPLRAARRHPDPQRARALRRRTRDCSETLR